MTVENFELLSMTAEIVSAHVAHNTVAVSDLPALISNVYSALARTADTAPPAIAAKLHPAVPVRNSIKPEYLVCLEDGKKLKMLKRHLMTHFQLTPDTYRAKWGLPKDYPMVAPTYRAQRQSLAIKIGLGRRAGDILPPPAPAGATADQAASEPPLLKPRRSKLKIAVG